MLGPYRLVEQIGAGGMGHVYRARDERLHRDVAIKTLPPAFSRDQERLHRFEREARAAAALNHPNILSIYDVQVEQGSAYIVSELLEGSTLREKLNKESLPVRVALAYARQILSGLVAAHQRHIVHRDLKPENLFILRDGRVKILDFGLAKLTEPEPIADPSEAATMETLETKAGTILGTLAYMSPEQLRNRPVDERSDIFSFGAILYEMLTGKRAFEADTTADLISAVLTQDPLERRQGLTPLPQGLESIVHHCLEKDPGDRFQSASDLLFNLETMAGALATVATTSIVPPPETAQSRNQAYLRWAFFGLALAAAIGGGILLGKKLFSKPLPAYHQLTFRRGRVWAARFTSDGNSVVYTSSWNGNPPEIFTTRAEGTTSRSLGLGRAELLAVSSSGELAVLLNRKSYPGDGELGAGTLARVPLEGGAAREVLEQVQEADWSPDGSSLAVVRYLGGKERIEYPVGKVLFETSGWISSLRVSPAGDRVAFLEHGGQWDDRGWVTVVDLARNTKRLSGEWASEEGLSWSRRGDEVWFTASKAEEAHALYAVSLSGEVRVVERAPTNLMLQDIARNGDVLLTAYKHSTTVMALTPETNGKERDLSWLDDVLVFDLSADGRFFIFQYYGEGSGANYTSYLRKTDGSPAVQLGEGAAIALSPDAKWVLTIMNQPRRTVLLPTGAGEPKELERAGFDDITEDVWLPDGKHVLFTASQPGKVPRSYVQDIDGGAPKPITPVGITALQVSPDGKTFLVVDAQGTRSLMSLPGTESRPVPGLADDDVVIRWGADGRSLYVRRPLELPLKIYRLDLGTGRKELLNEISVSDAAGISGYPTVFLSSDGRSYVYQFQRYLSELYLTKGLGK